MAPLAGARSVEATQVWEVEDWWGGWSFTKFMVEGDVGERGERGKEEGKDLDRGCNEMLH